MTLGQQPDVLRAITRLAAALGDDTREYVDLPRARGRLPGLLAARNCLLILDDAWDVAHVEPFANALGPRLPAAGDHPGWRVGRDARRAGARSGRAG